MKAPLLSTEGQVGHTSDRLVEDVLWRTPDERDATKASGGKDNKKEIKSMGMRAQRSAECLRRVSERGPLRAPTHKGLEAKVHLTRHTFAHCMTQLGALASRPPEKSAGG